MDFQVVVLAGGSSKQLAPLVSKEVPKALLPVANRPVISYVLEQLELSNVKDVIVVVEGEEAASQVGSWISGAYVDRLNIEVATVPEDVGTAGALRAIARYLTANVILVVSGDLVSDVPPGAVAAAHRRHDAADVEELMKEVQEARRIKMLHQPNKVMDMEHELRALRHQLAQKSKHSLLLQKELAKSKRGELSIFQEYELDGSESLGSCLRINPCSNNAPDLSKCSIQWYRVSPEDGKKELISGATKTVYAPEPFDVGRILQAEICNDGLQVTLTTTGPIDPAAGLGTYVEALVRKHDVEFNVVVYQINGVDSPSESIYVLHVGKMRMKLRKGKTTTAKEYYSSSMQLCGVRGGGNAATQALFWQAKKGVSFVLVFESERDRNAALMLARRFAFDCNIMLAGPDYRSPLET